MGDPEIKTVTLDLRCECGRILAQEIRPVGEVAYIVISCHACKVKVKPEELRRDWRRAGD